MTPGELDYFSEFFLLFIDRSLSYLVKCVFRCMVHYFLFFFYIPIVVLIIVAFLRNRPALEHAFKSHKYIAVFASFLFVIFLISYTCFFLWCIFY